MAALHGAGAMKYVTVCCKVLQRSGNVRPERLKNQAQDSTRMRRNSVVGQGQGIDRVVGGRERERAGYSKLLHHPGFVPTIRRMNDGPRETVVSRKLCLSSFGVAKSNSTSTGLGPSDGFRPSSAFPCTVPGF